MTKTIIICLFTGMLLLTGARLFQDDGVLLYDEFDDLRSGDLFSDVGAHSEYHFLKEAAPKGNWALTSFRNETQNSWSVQRDDGDRILFQKRKYDAGMDYHPMLVTGDEFWEDYTVEVKFAPLDHERQSGVVFRYRNDRCYYFFGVKDKKAVLKLVQHGKAWLVPHEQVLQEADFPFKTGTYLTARITVKGDHIAASFDGGPSLSITDTTFKRGKVAITADVPTKFSYVKVLMQAHMQEKFRKERSEVLIAEAALQAKNPKMKLWKKLDIKGFGVGRNLRFGDLNGDGQPDVLIGQVMHHGRADSYSELSCLTAMTFDGERLWQAGRPDEWKNHLTNDVAFQIHDIDNDGINEVIYTMNQQIYIAEAATGKIIHSASTPAAPVVEGRRKPLFERILGDCLFFCDLEGKGYDANIIIKDRYRNVWALNNKLEILWHVDVNAGHYPYAYDIDGDGKDEVVMGYNLINPDGSLRWSLDGKLKDHADGVAVVDYKNDGKLQIMCAASDEGMVFIGLDGNILRHHYIGHAQNPVVGNFRDDLPGLETIAINFWGNQGIIHFFDADGNIYHDFEPNQYGSMLLPLNWTGGSEEFVVHNANVEEGGIYDGFGRKAVVFPDDGHPDMCNAVLDITGDCRDEIVVWNPEEIWVYTQDDDRSGQRLYKPERNPLYNYSNYQATVSLPGWSPR